MLVGEDGLKPTHIVNTHQKVKCYLCGAGKQVGGPGFKGRLKRGIREGLVESDESLGRSMSLLWTKKLNL